MACLNSVQLIGNVSKAPTIKSMNSGDRVANFSMAMKENWKDKSTGEKKERVEWVNVVVWGDGLVRVIEDYVRAGSKIYVQGQLRTRKYEKDGQDRYATEVVLQGGQGRLLLLDGKSDSSGKSSSDGGNQSRHTRPAEQQYDEDDQIPF